MKGSKEEMPEALVRVVGEIRQEPDPDLDWDGLERKLLSDIERGRQPRYPARSRGPVLIGALSLAAAAVFALAIWGWSRSPVSTVSDVAVAVEDTAPRTLNGKDLEVGQRLTTGERPLSVKHAGLGSWLLDARSSSEVRANGETVVVQLQSGSLSASIVPSARPETFVVEVGNVRVAVHGTRFSVRRDADQAYVEVSEGVVAVSTQRQPEQTLLEAPASGRFHLTGKDAGRALEASGTVHPVRTSEPTRPEKVQATQNTASRELTFSDVEAGLAEVENVLRQCLAESTSARDKVKVSLETQVTLRIDAQGRVERYGFSPPLAPTLDVCADQRLRAVKFAQSVTGAHVIRDLSIELH